MNQFPSKILRESSIKIYIFTKILLSSWVKAEKLFKQVRPCVIDSLFRVPWPPEIGARTLLTQHKIYLIHSAFLLQIYTKSLCWEFSKSWKMDELCIFHLSCWKPETSKSVHALDPKQRINYAQPTITTAILFQQQCFSH
jgi:hypothetical protein